LVLKSRICRNVCRNVCAKAMTVMHLSLKHLGMGEVGIIPMLVIAIGLGTRVMVLHELGG
jgi:ABC-type nickel/cobalt efflux system permease component RcnA